MDKLTEIITLDYEWVTLMREAKAMGVTIEEVRLFLTGTKETAK